MTSPEVKAPLAKLLSIVDWQDLENRLIRGYLDGSEFIRYTATVNSLQRGILLVALDAFLNHKAIVFEGAVHPPSRQSRWEQAAPPLTRLIEIAPGRSTTIYHQALLFLRDKDDRRFLLLIDGKERDEVVTVLSRPGEMADFYQEWERFALQHAYLRGQRFYPSGELVQVEPAIRFKDVRLSNLARKQIERLVLGFPRQFERFRACGLSAKRGILLEGPPGTGKTLLCRALCHEVEATFIWLTARHAQGDAEVFAQVWDLARHLAPVVILLEDIDLYGGSRESGGSMSLLGELMNQMDGAEANDGILTIATTNRLDVVENALRNRPGRFDRVIHVGELQDQDRTALVTRYLTEPRFCIAAPEVLLAETQGFSGAQIMELVKTLIELVDDDRTSPSPEPSMITEDLVQRALTEMRGQAREPRIGFATPRS
jgi:AAA+ superfamily predicted ATPase